MPAWQTHNDLPLRKKLIERIRRFFLDNNSPRATQTGFPDLVKKVELLLYSSARSQAEYVDRDTLAARLKRFGSEVGMSDSSEAPANSGESYQLPPLLAGPCLGEYLYEEDREFSQELDFQFRPDMALDFESGDVLGCSSPAFQFQEKASPGSLDAKLLDAPFESMEFGENWLSFPEDDLISSEDSGCGMNGYGGGHVVSDTINSSYPSPWISQLHEEAPVPCGSGSLGFGEQSLVPDMFSNFDYSHVRQPQSLPFEGVPVPVSLEGYGTYPGSDMESCTRPIPSLSPTIFPMPDVARGEVKKAGINKLKARSKTFTPKFIKPRPLSRRWGLSTELQEDNAGNCGTAPFSSILRKEDIDPLVHAYTCTKSNCGIMCAQLKKLLNHVKKCSLRKTPMKCSSCQWMGLLLSMHAQKCNIKCCPLPCCTRR